MKPDKADKKESSEKADRAERAAKAERAPKVKADKVAKTEGGSIHPVYFNDAKVTCVCGNSFVTGSTVKELQTDICSECHPFYTGKQKLLDTEGRIERFKKRYAKNVKTPAS